MGNYRQRLTFTLTNVSPETDPIEYNYTEHLTVSVEILECIFKSVDIPFNNWTPYSYIVWNPSWQYPGSMSNLFIIPNVTFSASCSYLKIESRILVFQSNHSVVENSPINKAISYDNITNTILVNSFDKSLVGIYYLSI